MLVAAGANLTIQDNEGKTPKVLALLADDHGLAAYLEGKSQYIFYYYFRMWTTNRFQFIQEF